MRDLLNSAAMADLETIQNVYGDINVRLDPETNLRIAQLNARVSQGYEVLP